jgi:chaperonin GroES
MQEQIMNNPDGTVEFRQLNHSGLVPTADKLLIQPLQVEEKTSGGIVLASDVLKKEQLAQTVGTIIAVGKTASSCPEMDGIAVGDIVLVARYSGAEYQVEGVTYRIIRACDVIGKANKLPDSVMRGAQSSVEVFGRGDKAA